MKKRAHVIGIAGASCSGKGYLAQKLRDRLSCSSCLLISMDSYYSDRASLPPNQQDDRNFDLPEAIDRELFLDHLRRLAAGDEVELPEYDFRTHKRRPGGSRVCARGKSIIVEGLFVLHWEEVRQLLDFKIYVDLDAETCLARRIERDTRERGRSLHSVQRQFQETVLPMFRLHVRPTKRFADLVVCGDAPAAESIDRVLRCLEETAQ